MSIAISQGWQSRWFSRRCYEGFWKPELRMKKRSAFNFISEYKLVFKFIGIKISGDTDQLK